MTGHSSKPSELLFWLDVETTGLDLEKDILLEIAIVLTDWDLNEVDIFHELIVSVNPHRLRRIEQPLHAHMSDGVRCFGAHFNSGLVDKLIEKSKKWGSTDLAKLQDRIINWLVTHRIGQSQHYSVGPAEERPPLCGSSVWFDRRFLERFMPRILMRLSHRQIDVSSFRQVQKMWAPDFEVPEKKEAHRALDDIRESIELLKFYRAKGYVGFEPVQAPDAGAS